MPFTAIPLGQPIPPGAHSVSCSLPTMRDVIGYEEKDPAITQHLTSGYPRFVQHPFLREAGLVMLAAAGRRDHQFWPTASARAAAALREWLAPAPAEVLSLDGFHGVAFPTNADTHGRAKLWLQHCGRLASSRAAEDFLVRQGHRTAAVPEALFTGDAHAEVHRYLRRVFAPATGDDLFLANCGMNAMWAAFHAASTLQASRGRRLWIQLGWLYLDTIALLQKFNLGVAPVVLGDVFALDQLRALFASRGHEIAGIITEVPTNPLIQTPDLIAVHQLCRDHGALLIVDPSIASPVNLDVLPHTDIVVNSLTKYTASEGDVLAGALAINPSTPNATSLRAAIAAELEPVHDRDLARLAAQIGETEAVVAQGNAAATEVVEFLRHHPRIDALFWSLEPRSRDSYTRLARTPASTGSMISFTVRGSLARFYDRLTLPKGPSFGMRNSLICPFIYLAHYDLVTSESGRATLAAHGLNPDLLRLSVGCEPASEIIAALRDALEA
jgi:cystathionine gamma-synthase